MRRPVGFVILLSFFFFFSWQGLLAAEKRDVSLNFKNIDIRNFVEIMSKLSGRTYLFEENKIKGKITLISQQKFTKSEAVKIFETILDVNNLSLVDDGVVVRITLKKEARFDSKLFDQKSKGKLSNEFVTRLITVQYADLKQVRSLLAPMISREAVLNMYEPSSLLILSDTLANSERIAGIVKAIDRPESDVTVTLFPLGYANAQKLSATLNRVYSKLMRGKVRAGSFTITFDDRSNQLVLIADHETTQHVKKIIEELDKPISDLQVEFFEVINADTKELANLITQILQFQHQEKGKPSKSAKVKVFADEQTSSLIVVGDEATRTEIRDLIKKIDKTDTEERKRGNFRVFKLKYAKADKVAEILQKLISGRTSKPVSKGPGKGAENIKTNVIADTANNSIVVHASPSELAVLEDVIKELDVVRPQIYLEALIIEATLDKSLDLGVQWSRTYATDKEVGVISSGSDARPQSVDGAVANSDNSVMGVMGSTFTYGGNTYTSFSGFVKAVQDETDVEILASPKILTLNNEEAEIKVGKVVPTLKSEVITSEGGTTTKGYDYKEVGVSLKITPQINEGDTVQLKVQQTSNNLVRGELDDEGAITTLNRSLNTNVLVSDSQTVVLGGLISDQEEERVQKTPCLGDIPGLGWLFKSKAIVTDKVNLFVFIRPKIIRSQEDLENLSQQTSYQLKRARQGSFKVDVTKEFKLPALDPNRLQREKDTETYEPPVMEETDDE